MKLKNGCLEVLELMDLFLLKTEICVLYFCVVKVGFKKRETTEYKVSLMIGSSLISPRIQHKVVLLVLRTVFAVGV